MQTVIQNLLPLALTAPMAAARLNSLQGRWGHNILMGRAFCMDSRLTRKTDTGDQVRPGTDTTLDHHTGTLLNVIPKDAMGAMTPATRPVGNSEQATTGHVGGCNTRSPDNNGNTDYTAL